MQTQQHSETSFSIIMQRVYTIICLSKASTEDVSPNDDILSPDISMLIMRQLVLQESFLTPK